MDIEILLALQQFRDGPGAFLAEFLNKMTFLGDLSTVTIIMAVMYWCVSKEFGTYLLLGWSGNRIVNGALKVTACAYRPWIRDARIVPYGNSINTATGYSFPSGHSMNAATVFGGGAVRRELPRVLRVTLTLIVVLVGFSRNYLGVHTPQDVLVGLAVGTAVMWATARLVRYLEAHPEKDVLVALIGLGLAVLVALYAGFKSYPEDYDAAGKLLVDGMKMANDTFKCVGWCAAILSGWLLERRFVKFTTDVPLPVRMTRLTVGMLSYYAVSLIVVPWIKSALGGPIGTMVSCYVQLFYIMFAFPWLMTRVEQGKRIPERIKN